MSNNPYEPVDTRHLTAEPKPANRRRWAAYGFVIAYIPITAIGAYGLYADAHYGVTLPRDFPRCGWGEMLPVFWIFPISPMFGCFGAGIGVVSATIRNATMIGGSQKTEDVR